MPLKRLKNGRYRAISYSTGKALGHVLGRAKDVPLGHVTENQNVVL